MLAAAVFVAAALTGAHLGDVEPAVGPVSSGPTVSGPATSGPASSGPATACPAGCGQHASGPLDDRPAGFATDRTFALSLIYSGTGALAVSVLGLVMVGRRRRRW